MKKQVLYIELNKVLVRLLNISTGWRLISCLFTRRVGIGDYQAVTLCLGLKTIPRAKHFDHMKISLN